MSFEKEEGKEGGRGFDLCIIPLSDFVSDVGCGG